MVSLAKNILPGTWRYLGQLAQPNLVENIPIAGRTRTYIYWWLKGLGKGTGTSYRIGRVNPRNAFVIKQAGLWLVYVRPDYKDYRKIAKKIWPHCAWPIDYDHALGKQLANKLNMGYVLLLRIPPAANRSHGHCERPANVIAPINHSLLLCLADDRIREKWIGARVGVRSSTTVKIFNSQSPTNLGETLQQRGKIAYALGLGNHPYGSTQLKQLCYP